jgi:acyl carrier protein
MEQKYREAFVSALSISDGTDFKNLKYNDIPEWDSIGHMTLISELEEKFSISFETDDIVNFSSFEEGKKILNKMGVKL